MAIAQRLRRRRRFRKNRIFRPRFDVKSMNNSELQHRYRFSYQSIMFILGLIQDDLQNQTRRSHAVDPLLQLLVASRYFATGAFFRLVGDSVGLSEATVSRCVHRVAAALARKAKEFVKFPTGEAAAKVKKDYYKLSSKF